MVAAIYGIYASGHNHGNDDYDRLAAQACGNLLMMIPVE